MITDCEPVGNASNYVSNRWFICRKQSWEPFSANPFELLPTGCFVCFFQFRRRRKIAGRCSILDGEYPSETILTPEIACFEFPSMFLGVTRGMVRHFLSFSLIPRVQSKVSNLGKRLVADENDNLQYFVEYVDNSETSWVFLNYA